MHENVIPTAVLYLYYTNLYALIVPNEAFINSTVIERGMITGRKSDNLTKEDYDSRQSKSREGTAARKYPFIDVGNRPTSFQFNRKIKVNEAATCHLTSDVVATVKLGILELPTIVSGNTAQAKDIISKLKNGEIHLIHER